MANIINTQQNRARTLLRQLQLQTLSRSEKDEIAQELFNILCPTISPIVGKRAEQALIYLAEYCYKHDTNYDQEFFVVLATSDVSYRYQILATKLIFERSLLREIASHPNVSFLARLAAKRRHRNIRNTRTTGI